MDKYFEADKQLAELLYSKEYELCPTADEVRLYCTDREGYKMWWDIAPRWTQDSAAVFDLMVKYNVYPDADGGLVWVGNGDDFYMQCENIESHPDKTTAMRYAVVLAVIEKLKKEVAK